MSSSLALSDPTVISLVVEHARWLDLASLCLTSKFLSASAARRLYNSLILSDPVIALHACETLASSPRLAAHVRTLLVGPGPPPLWHAFQRALEVLPNLGVLSVEARGLPVSWVLPRAPPFRLRDLRLSIPWDAKAAAFVRAQPTLRALRVHEPPADNAISLAAPGPNAPPPNDAPADADTDSEIKLPFLASLECSPRIACAFVRSPLTHLQIFGDPGGPGASHLLRLIPRLAHARATLRSLTLYDVPEASSVSVTALTAQYCPQLQRLGVLPLPPGSRADMHAVLMRFDALAVLELELGAWSPPPPTSLQRALVAELHIFGSGLRAVSMWVSARRFVWRYDAEAGSWAVQVDQRETGGWGPA
ncbi:hypothetical protein BC834DRAFT_828916 [Gloeopeniophorella convolvens]|nr:hypothetical protein BC834DRAFT_828916 [Gloeopeniophorella convolvens]